MDRFISILIGYGFGCFLTAELVAKSFAGKTAKELGGTGNPGMANVMAQLGFIPGILTLAGDLAKCVLASLTVWLLFGSGGGILILYAGLGCTLGHDFPFWRKFRGGKGVATTSIAIVLYAFLPGLLANAAGMLVVFFTKYLCIGGPVIPLVFMIAMAVRGEPEAAVAALVLAVLSFWSHGSAIRGIRAGETKRTDVLAAIKKKVRRS
ncbi:MAG: glycerol-3-phosphate acyltransferase [Eubacterium sp.]|nr:glycerol-3-phosphate acyltransferase [Eubacterium sp.]